MAHWLVKQEPTSYSFSTLLRDGRTRWDGVHNALALRHLRAMRPGDEAIFYHSGGERACVGILRVASSPRPDPGDSRGSWFVEVTPVRALARPVPLAEIRADRAFEGFTLLRMSRLSVMPVPEPMYARLLALSERAGPSVLTAGGTGRGRAGARQRRRTSARRRR
ncbi:MAG TPA: EVE domain-containing protein [Thermoplasmata archaeon]|nr:EVE domain-containing protein [Thermoplasmata archaeon]